MLSRSLYLIGFLLLIAGLIWLMVAYFTNDASLIGRIVLLAGTLTLSIVAKVSKSKRFMPLLLVSLAQLALIFLS